MSKNRMGFKKKNNIVKIFEKENDNDIIRKILIKDLIIKKIFGFYPKEKIKPQRLKFNIKLELSKKLVFKNSDLKTIVDYDKVIKIIYKILDKKINFLENLADQIIEEVLKNNKINCIELKIEKLDILKNDASVGIEVSKRKS